MTSSAMVQKTVPFDLPFIRKLSEQYPTPFHIYDEQAIRANARRFITAFSWCDAFKEFFAVKATPNPHLLDILREEGFGADCSSLTELMLCDAVGIRGEDIMFSSNDTPVQDYAKARELGALINLDDITHIDFLRQTIGLPDVVSFRYNPGPLRQGNAIIGTPEDAKYGFTRDQLFEGYRRLKTLGIQRLGLHTMVVSNELKAEFFLETARMLFELVVEISDELDIRLEFVNLGGGIGIPYRPTEEPVDLEYIGDGIRQLYERMIEPAGLHPLKIFTENGRMVTGPYGYLVTKAVHKKDIYKQYIGVDACMANLMRPGMYGAYHHITVLGKENAAHDHTYDVAGSLCENNDKFAIDRSLPAIDRGDFLVIHDTGAHGHAMGFQYNGKLRSAELLLCADGTVKQIRRAETASDYFATLDYAGLPREFPQ